MGNTKNKGNTENTENTAGVSNVNTHGRVYLRQTHAINIFLFLYVIHSECHVFTSLWSKMSK